MWCQGDQPYRPPGSQGDRMRTSYPKARERSTVTALALKAAAAGRAVFPVKEKAPLTSHGYKDASRDRSRVMAMFNAAPNASGYGIRCGPASRIVVLDLDG